MMRNIPETALILMAVSVTCNVVMFVMAISQVSLMLKIARENKRLKEIEKKYNRAIFIMSQHHD